MSYPINYPTPQGADVQIFYRNTVAANNTRNRQAWIKPQGASFVWFTLIGPGGNGGDATTDTDASSTARGGGGGGGGIVNFLVPAFLIPDELLVSVDSGGGGDTIIFYRGTGTQAYELMRASGGNLGTNASATGGSTNNGGGGNGSSGILTGFNAAGIYQATFGQNGTAGGTSQTTSTDRLTMGGPGGNGAPAASPYGYTVGNVAGRSGYGFLQPILNTTAPASPSTLYTTATAARAVKAGFGSGGAGATSIGTNDTRFGTYGGDGLVVIISW